MPVLRSQGGTGEGKVVAKNSGAEGHVVPRQRVPPMSRGVVQYRARVTAIHGPAQCQGRKPEMPLGPGKDKGLQPSAIRSVVAKDDEGGSPAPLSDDEHLRRRVGVAAAHRLPGRENEPTDVSRQKPRRRKRHRFLSSAPRVWKQPHDVDAGVGAGLMSHSRGAQLRPTFEVSTGQSRRTFFSLASSIVTVAMGVLNFCSVNAQGQRHLMGKIEVIGPCTVHDGFCFQSPNYPSSYAKNQSCTITVTSAAGPDDILMVEAFNTVSDLDILTVGSTEYSGWGGPWGWSPAKV